MEGFFERLRDFNALHQVSSLIVIFDELEKSRRKTYVSAIHLPRQVLSYLQYGVKYGVVDTECFLQLSMPPDPKAPLKVRSS